MYDERRGYDMATSEILVGGLIVALTLLSVAVSVLRLAQANPLQQLRGLLGLAAVVGMVILVVAVALIFHNVQSKLGPANAPNAGFPTQSTFPTFSGDFATPTIPTLVR